MTDSIAFGGLSHRRQRFFSPTTFDPLTERTRLLYMPGDYSVTGTPGVDQVGTWLDSSRLGYGINAVSVDTQLTGVAPDATGGVATFVASGNPLRAAISLADESTYPSAYAAKHNAGTIIIISQTSGGLQANASDYFNAAWIAGDGATPGMTSSDAGGKIWGYDTTVYKTAVGGPVTDAVSTISFGQWDANGISCRQDAGDFVTTPFNVPGSGLSIGNIGANTWIGSTYGGVTVMGGILKLVAVYDEIIPVSKCNEWRAWAIARGLV